MTFVLPQPLDAPCPSDPQPVSHGMIIVSNTSPINHLILIGHIDLLPELFQQIIIPQAVYSELSDAAAPLFVQTWIATPPDWLKIQPVTGAVV
jgi:predicted nucleic acid-binding protein